MSADIREGEIAVSLPEKFDAGVYFIGRIRTPWTQRDQCPKNARGSNAECTIDLDPRTHKLYLVAAQFGPPPSPTTEQPRPRPAMVPGTFEVLVVGR